jgi:hypothetical protein
MKTYFSSLTLVFLVSIVAAIALPEPEWFPIGANELGTVYSNIAPSNKRDVTEHEGKWYPMATNELGTVYTSVAPSNSNKRDINERDINERDGDTWYPIGSNEIGTVYSNVSPEKRDSVDDYKEWLTEK